MLTNACICVFSLFLSRDECQGKKGRLKGGGVAGDTAGEHGTMGALWHQPLDSSSRSPKTLNSPTMNCCSRKAGFGEFNFQHNWLYSHPLNAKKMVCSVCLCVESFAYSKCPLAGGEKRREGWQRQAGRTGRRHRDRNSATVLKRRKNE